MGFAEKNRKKGVSFLCVIQTRDVFHFVLASDKDGILVKEFLEML